MSANDIWEIERLLWVNGESFFAETMTDDCLMVFPDPVGILEGNEIVEGLRKAPRWSDVEMDKRTTVDHGKTIVLAYRATGVRHGDGTYRAFCMSVYERDGTNWRIAAHQQTPV